VEYETQGVSRRVKRRAQRLIETVLDHLLRQRIVRGLIERFLFRWYYPHIYTKAARRPVIPNKVLFIEPMMSELSDNYLLLHDKLTTEYNVEIHTAFLHHTHTSTLRYYNNCRAMLKEMATAKYVFLNDASPEVSCVKVRAETKIAQLWHACGAFKKFGMSTADLIFGGSRKFLLRRPHYKNLDLVTVSSPEVVWAYAEAMVLEDHPEIIKPLGISRTDVFFDPEFLSTARSELNTAIHSSSDKKVIAYAPTFRGRVATAEGPNALDIPAMRKALGSDYILLIKHHPFVTNPPAIPESCQDFAYFVEDDLPIDKLLCTADILISDYSSVIFEYSLFERPMIFFAYDKEEYDDWRGFYYPYDELAPGPVFTSTDEITNHIVGIEQNFDVQEVIDFKTKFMSSCDGSATERIFEEAFGSDLAPYQRKTALNVLSEKNPQSKDVSIIIPAHNAMPELTRALESIVTQTYPLERIEAVVVDDGSTDGTWKEIQAFAKKYPQVIVPLRLDKASGSPALPRNVGLDHAQGEYVFCLDADDWLGAQAMEKALNHAINWNSDVLYTKMVGVNGRVPPRSMFRANSAKVDLFGSNVLWSLAPLKLFRRSLIENNGIRFPVDAMPEDQAFVLQALFAADTVSVASDYGYYYVSWRENEDKNTSPATWNDLDSNLRAFTEVLEIIQQGSTAEQREKVLTRRLFERDVASMFNSLVANYPEQQWSDYAERITNLFGPLFTDTVRSTMAPEKAFIIEMGMAGNFPVLQAITPGASLPEPCSVDIADGQLLCSTVENGKKVTYDISEAVSLTCQIESIDYKTASTLVLEGSLRTTIGNRLPTPRVFLVLKNRNNTQEVVVHCFLTPQDLEGKENQHPTYHWSCHCDVDAIDSRSSVWSLYLRASFDGFESETRLGNPPNLALNNKFLAKSRKKADGTLYVPHITEYGNYDYREVL